MQAMGSFVARLLSPTELNQIIRSFAATKSRKLIVDQLSEHEKYYYIINWYIVEVGNVGERVVGSRRKYVC